MTANRRVVFYFPSVSNLTDGIAFLTLFDTLILVAGQGHQLCRKDVIETKTLVTIVIIAILSLLLGGVSFMLGRRGSALGTSLLVAAGYVLIRLGLAVATDATVAGMPTEIGLTISVALLYQVLFLLGRRARNLNQGH